MSNCLSVRIRVGWGDCDPAGIVFYPRFYAWMDNASHVLAREMGIPRESMLPPGNDLLGFPVVSTQALNAIIVSRNLERTADHATNIAEDVIFWVRGSDVRHKFSLAQSD